MKKSIIKLMPIGGQAENGKSMYCLEIDDNWFIIDAGYRFPEVDKLGVDVIIPNFDYLKDNKDKIINKGNAKLKQMSLILEDTSSISEYLEENQYKADLLVDYASYQKGSYFEVINNDVEGFETLENSLNLNKENKYLCLVNQQNRELCLKKKHYLIEPTLTLNSTNYIDVKNKLESGSIILIDGDAKLSDIKLLLKEIKFKNYQIVYLSELISEENE